MVHCKVHGTVRLFTLSDMKGLFGEWCAAFAFRMESNRLDSVRSCLDMFDSVGFGSIRVGSRAILFVGGVGY